MTLSLCAMRAPVSLSCSLLASIGRPLALPVLAVCLGLGAGPAMAQTTGPQQSAAAATAPAEGQLEEVTVTARFRAEKLQETPLAITAVTGDTLAARGETDVTNLAAFVPNAVINPLGAGWGATIAASIRGVGLSDNSLSFVGLLCGRALFGRWRGESCGRNRGARIRRAPSFIRQAQVGECCTAAGTLAVGSRR